MRDSDFAGKHVVITGGSGGLGVSVVTELLARGAHCHVPCFEATVPASFTLAHNERVTAVAAVDLGNDAAIKKYFDSLPGVWASIHLAGGFSMAPILETTQNDFVKMMNLNALTTFLSCREAVRRIGQGQGGRIVNVGARPVVAPTGGMVAYAASKAAVATITQSLAEEVKSQKIWVNAVLPSIIDTAANRAAMPKADFDSWPKAGELAQTIAFLASPDNALTTGALVPVYGLA